MSSVNQMVVCNGAISTNAVSDVPPGMVMTPNGQTIRQEALLGAPKMDASKGMVLLPGGEIKDVQELAKMQIVHMERDGGSCTLISKGELVGLAVTEAAAYLLIGVVFTYIFARARTFKGSELQLQLRASFLLSGLFFLVGTIGLFLGTTGDVEFNVGPVSINTAIPSLLLFLFTWLIWRAAMAKTGKITKEPSSTVD